MEHSTDRLKLSAVLNSSLNTLLNISPDI